MNILIRILHRSGNLCLHSLQTARQVMKTWMGLPTTLIILQCGSFHWMELQASVMMPFGRFSRNGWKMFLKENEKKWTILTLHQPFYSTSRTRDNAQIRDSFQDLLEKYSVDIVLQGHDHAYGRGMMEVGAEQPGNRGSMYVVSVSGPKMYEVGEEKTWIQTRKENTQLYQVITLDGDQLFYKSFDITGERIDEFVLTKTTDNRVILE